MEGLAIYLFKVHASISLLFVIYHFTVNRESFFRLNRLVLIGIIIFSFGIPLLPVIHISETVQHQLPTGLQKTFNNSASDTTPGDLLKGMEITELKDSGNINIYSSVIDTFVIIYLFISFSLMLRFISQLRNVLYLIRSSDRISESNVIYRDPGLCIPSFSFFNAILINSEQYSKEQLRQVLAHERAHANQGHSVDIILVELAGTILWCNPVLRLLKKTVKLNLEFLADKEVLSKGFEKKAYQWSILMPYMEKHEYPLTNLFSSKPGLRIERMNSEQGSVFKLYKYAFIFPVLVFIYLYIRPLHVSAFDNIYRNKLIENHHFVEYLGYYEFENDRGSFIQISMKDNQLIMRTLWSDEKIYFEKKSEREFINKEKTIPISFSRDSQGSVTRFVAFENDSWNKVEKYRPFVKPREGMAFGTGEDGKRHVYSYAVDPWRKVKHYTTRSRAAGP